MVTNKTPHCLGSLTLLLFTLTEDDMAINFKCFLTNRNGAFTL